jgi:predicted O-methyltransferase YrrM
MHLGWSDVWAPGAPTGAVTISTAVTPAETRELAKLADGKIVLEIGAAYGFSACVMALAGARMVTSVDPHGGGTQPYAACPGSLAAMQQNLSLCGVEDRVAMVLERSHDVLPSLDRVYDLVFIDGDHRFNAVRADMVNALGLVIPGGVIACHDYAEDCCCPEVRSGLDSVVPEGPDRVIDTLAVYQR